MANQNSGLVPLFFCLFAGDGWSWHLANPEFYQAGAVSQVSGQAGTYGHQAGLKDHGRPAGYAGFPGRNMTFAASAPGN